MSVYQQSHPFGQVAYPPQGYGQLRGPMSVPYQYQSVSPPAPAPIYHVDPNVFRRDYSAKLAELTINSRPIIQSLSMIAQEYSRWATIVVQCIEAHIRRVPPWMKLPAFYVLDAISKNVFDPYARVFTPVVIQLFLDAYEQVDPPTKSKMEEMLLTWRTGAPNSKELFGVGPQVAIERGIWGLGGNQQGLAVLSDKRNTISKSQVLSELEFTLGQKQRALQANPFDTTALGQVNALHQLRVLVDTGVSQDELRQILQQLRAMMREVPPVPQPPPPMAPAVAQPSTSYPVPPMMSFDTAPVSSSFPPSFLPPPAPSTMASGHDSNPITLAVPMTASSAPAVPSNIAGLFNALVKAGVVLDTVPSAEDGCTTSNVADEPKADVVDPERVLARQYRKYVLSHPIKLSTADIIRQRPAVAVLYDRLPSQCKQCGIRFPDGAVGKKKLDDHLDMHFRQNRKANQNLGRGYSRSWFVEIDDWIHDSTMDAKGKGRADGSRRLSTKVAAAQEAAHREAELRAMRVVVPAGDEAKAVRCPICKEELKSEFIEDDEEWAWRNAVQKDDKLFHATCHAEALISSSTLAARLRNEESASRSRSGTPDVTSSSFRATPPRGVPPRDVRKKSESPSAESVRSSTKRKAEHESASSGSPTRDEPSPPPAKKIAASA